MICLVHSLIVDLLVSTSPSGHDALRYCCAGIIQWTMPTSSENAYVCRKNAEARFLRILGCKLAIYGVSPYSAKVAASHS